MTDPRQCHAMPMSEMQRRWNAVRAAMAERSLDALVIQASQDWVGGYPRWFIDEPANNGYPLTVIFPRDGWMIVIEMGSKDGARVQDGGDPANRGIGRKRFTPSFASIRYSRHYDSTLAVEELRALGARSIGLVASGQMQYDFAAHLQATMTEARWSDATELVDRIKCVKSEVEIAHIRKTAALQDQVMAAVAAWVRPGLRDYEIAAYAQQQAQLLGSEQGIFLGSSAPLGQPALFLPRWRKQRALAAGEHFSLLLETNGPGGYYTELGRILVLGKAPQRLVDGVEAMKEAQRHILGLLRPGVAPNEVHAASNGWLRARGYPEETRLNAHGMGYDMVERPLVRSDETMLLAANMNIVVHPGFVDETMFAVVCDNYLVLADGPPQPLHATPQRIFEL